MAVVELAASDAVDALMLLSSPSLSLSDIAIISSVPIAMLLFLLLLRALLLPPLLEVVFWWRLLMLVDCARATALCLWLKRETRNPSLEERGLMVLGGRDS